MVVYDLDEQRDPSAPRGRYGWGQPYAGTRSAAAV